jgi:hypothetical protein
VPLRHSGYSISYRRGGRKRNGETDDGWHAHVEIERDPFFGFKAQFLSWLSLHLTSSLIRNLPKPANFVSVLNRPNDLPAWYELLDIRTPTFGTILTLFPPEEALDWLLCVPERVVSKDFSVPMSAIFDKNSISSNVSGA